MKKEIKLNQAVILAGGRGERLRPLTDRIPKPMAPVNGAPFLDYLINSLCAVGIKHLLILAGYKAGVIMDRYGNALKDRTRVKYSVGAIEWQTGRRLLNAHALLDDYFLLLYGDNYWPLELKGMLSLYREKEARVLTAVFSNKDGTGEYGKKNNIEVGDDNFVKQYDPGKKSPALNGVDIGYFIIDKSALKENTAGNPSFEKDILPALIRKREVIAYVTDRQYYYITDMASLRNFQAVAVKNGIKPIPKELF